MSPVASTQKAARIDELKKRLGIQFSQMVSTDPPTNEVSLAQAAEEMGVDFGLLLRAAANFDLSPINGREARTPETRTSEEKAEFSACVSRPVLKHWFDECGREAASAGISIDAYLRERYLGVEPVRAADPVAVTGSVEQEMEGRGIGSIFRSAIQSGEITMVDGTADPASVKRWEEGLMKMGKTLKLSGEYTIGEALVFVPDIERKSLEGALTQGRLVGATQEKKKAPWKIPAHALARWYNEVYNRRGGKSYILVAEDGGTTPQPAPAPVKEVVGTKRGGGPKGGVDRSVQGNPVLKRERAAKASITIPSDDFTASTVRVEVNIPSEYQESVTTNAIVSAAISGDHQAATHSKASRTMMNDPDVNKETVVMEMRLSELALVMRAAVNSGCDGSLDTYVLAVLMGDAEGE